MVSQVRLYKNFLTFVFFFKFVTNWWISLHFYMILCHKKPIAHDVLPDETQVETQYVKFNVTPDKMAYDIAKHSAISGLSVDPDRLVFMLV